MKRNEEQNEAKCNKKYPRFQNDEISPLRCEMTIKEDTIDTSTAPVISNIEGVLLNGTQLILEKVFNLIGFGAIDDDILKQLVIARLSQPMSKLATVDYLKAHFDEEVKLHKIYRYLDKLYNTQKDRVQQISVGHTKKVLGGQVGLMFYDVTTLYFETDYEDGFRETGFSKDGKHSQPQLVLGLLVSRDGYPLSYSLFPGEQYEGYTMIPIVEDFVKRFDLGKDFVIVADSGLMNKTNIGLLESGGYQYIIGARIKGENEKIKEWILGLQHQDDVFYEMPKGNARLIISYSAKRAKKDKYNRDRGIERLKKTYKSGKLTKDSINKRGYNKFLEISQNVHVTICQEKIIEDQRWDGLKGYLTNTELPAQEVYFQYNSLWAIERAYRITKGTIELRPMFHFSERRIEAHICICFVAYKVYKELERIIKLTAIDLSVDKVINIAKTVATLKVKLPASATITRKTLLLTKKQKEIAFLFDESFWKNMENQFG
ncbi:MAG: IS1634 family transposase [Chitinophagaceae bacterium]|jgi:transposase|nr:IS1634 family transposase [Chitinophagaceae bacterium]HRN49371.1 IS1634 family transposase [Niabella sp.]